MSETTQTIVILAWVLALTSLQTWWLARKIAAIRGDLRRRTRGA